MALCVGVDLDNTIICYDEVFERVAAEKGLLSTVPGDCEGKQGVKARVIESHGPDAWTELQGEVYSVHTQSAVPYPGATEFFRRCTRNGIPVYILSHKTKYPAMGPDVDLRRAAMSWLSGHGWFDPDDVGMSSHHVRFFDTAARKLEAISEHGCSVFVDDLPEFLSADGFPSDTRPLLFDPRGRYVSLRRIDRFSSWDDIAEQVLGVL